jgi:hypothetical protein
MVAWTRLSVTLTIFFYLKTVVANGEVYLDVLKLMDVSLLDLDVLKLVDVSLLDLLSNDHSKSTAIAISFLRPTNK